MPEHMINDENIVSNINISNSNYRLQRLTKLFIELLGEAIGVDWYSNNKMNKWIKWMKLWNEWHELNEWNKRNGLYEMSEIS